MKTLLALALLALVLVATSPACPATAASPLSPLYPGLPPRPLPPTRAPAADDAVAVYVGLWWRGPDTACELWRMGDTYRLECE